MRGNVLFWLFFCILIKGLSFSRPHSQNTKADFSSFSPPKSVTPDSLGFSGMVGGMYNDIVIVAGGVHSLGSDGPMVWNDFIHIFRNNEWTVSKKRLPVPIAYGASVKTPKGILVIGGDNAKTTLDRVLMISYEQGIKITDYPALPRPLSHMAAVLDEDYVYVIGGKDSLATYNSFYRLNLSEGEKWEKLPSFPGFPRCLHNAVVQQASNSKKIYVIGGRNDDKGITSRLHHTYLSYDLTKGVWDNEKSIEVEGREQLIAGAISRPMGSMHLLVYGGFGDRRPVHPKQGETKFTNEKSGDGKQGFPYRKKNVPDEYNGQGNKVVAYNTITEKWFLHDTLPYTLSASPLGVAHNETMYIVSGKVSTKDRVPKLFKIEPKKSDKSFGILNYIVLVAYLSLSLIIGLFFSKRQRSTSDYFKGGGRIPWWASGLSVFGTLLSAITFMAIPSKSFFTDWSYFLINITAILIVPLITIGFIPYFNKLNLSTAYEFLEQRFNYGIRVLGSLSFILFQLGRIGIVLLLPSLAISVVTGISVEGCVLVMGLLCIIYTAYGGIEAVIWTDVLQVVVLLGGSILAIFWLLGNIEKTPIEIYHFAVEKDKLNVFNMDLNLVDSTFWVVFFGGLASALVTQGTDQTIVQRYLTSPEVSSSKKTAYTNAVLTLPATFIFFGLGTLLFVFYSINPTRLSPGLSNNDSILPWYIFNELPKGFSGLLIAGIFSAAMSSLSSSLNSVSTSFCNDFYKKWKVGIADKELLKIGRITTVVVGIVGVVLALWMANAEIKSLWDQFYRFLGLFTGGLGGIFLLGLFNRKCNAQGALCGLIASALVIWWVSNYTEINYMLYSFIGVVSCFSVGSIVSLFSKGNKARLEGNEKEA